MNYEYRIGRTEITTGQWLQFVNTFSVQGSQWNGFAVASHWGAIRDLSYQGPGRRYALVDSPDAAMRPVFGITWREAAMYCNWLNNNQSAEPAALNNGAYDASTFGDNPDGTFNDQRTHNPGARFWIPTFDEWIKAAHYDRNRFGPGQGGYWLYDTSSETPPIPGPPGVGETSAGYRVEPFGHFDIPLGAYPNTLSPWGLLDTSGGSEEWTEETFEEVYGERRWRFADGNYAGNPPDFYPTDMIHFAASLSPWHESSAGLRIAASIPPPRASVCGVVFVAWFLFSRRRAS